MRDLILKDLGWKLLSLALAVAIWLTVQPLTEAPSERRSIWENWETQTFTNLPVLLVVSAAADVHEFKVNPDVVTVTVSGRPEMISAMTGQEIRVTVDLTGIEAARGLRKRVEVSVPPGVAFIRAEPPDVNVIVPPKRD